MPIIPNFIERLILLRLNRGPGPMLDYLGAVAFRAICVAFRLGVFEALNGGRLTAVDIAHQINADERSTAVLLEALEALGYVKKKGDAYVSTAMTAKWLPLLASGLPLFERYAFERWGYLEQSIRRGKPVMSTDEWNDRNPDGWREYQVGLGAFARIGADNILAKVKLSPAARRLLDVGGGHGVYSIEFCRRYPRLSATVFDRPQALEAAREVIAAEEMGERVSVQEGDYWVDDLGSGYDVALLFNIIHSYLPEMNTELLRKVAGALNTGGLVVILDPFAGKPFGPAAKAGARLQALHFVNSGCTQTYAFEEIAGFLTAAGFNNSRRINLLRSPGNGLVLATKAG